MSTPKCEECKNLITEYGRGKQSKDKNYCYGTITTDNAEHQVGVRKFIYVRELLTSPMWCPKRITGTHCGPTYKNKDTALKS